jgi:hypothetical protein
LVSGINEAKKENAADGNRGQSKKTCSVPKNLRDKSGENVTRRCAQPDRYGNQALSEVKAPGTPH